MTVIGRAVLGEDKILGASVCIIFKENVEIGKTHWRHTDNLIERTRALFLKTAAFHLRQFRKDFSEFHCAFLGYGFLPVSSCDRSNWCFTCVSMSVYK